MPRAASLALVALVALVAAACGPAEPTSVIHPGSSDAARAVLEVDFIKPITIAEMAILRPDERAVVTSDPERGWLYVGSRDGSLLILDAEDGHLIWEHAFGGAIASEPVLLAGEPVLLVGTDNGSLTALDLETRAPRWTYETQGTIRGRPLLIGDVVYFANSRDQVFALDVRSGTWRWQYEQPLPTDFTVFGRAGLAFVDEHAGAAVPEGGVVLTGFSNGRVVAIGAGSGEALWMTSVAPPEGGAFVDADGTPLVVGGDEVVVSGQATGVYGLSLADGAERWHRPVRGAGTVIDAGDGSLIFASSLEGVFAIERGGRLRWRQQQDPGVLSEPVLVGSVVLVGHSEQGLGAYDRVSGELLARLDVGSGVSGKPSLDPVFGRLYAITNRGYLLAFRVGDGASASAS